MQNPIHVFDSESLPIIFGELDTVVDFSAYLFAKIEAIKLFDYLSYCGEEDLLANYFLNFDEVEQRHFIGTKKQDINGVAIGEGEWKDFIELDAYKKRTTANEISYFWDELLQRTSQNALDGILLGDGNIF